MENKNNKDSEELPEDQKADVRVSDFIVIVDSESNQEILKCRG